MDRRLPDESFAAAGLKSVVFLVRQPVLWVPTVLFAVVFGGWMLALSYGSGRLTLESLLILVGLAPVCGFGFAALTALPGFFLYRLVTAKKPSFAPTDDEELLDEAPANHFLGGEGRGGRLYVTDRRVVFLPHRFNFQLEPVELSREHIEETGWRRIMRDQLVMSHKLEVATAERREIFVVGRAQELADALSG